jgi:hypothetical protein
VLLAEDYAQEQAEPFNDVVFEPVSVNNRNHVVFIWHEARA